jgi:hypothetical protein
MLDQSTRTAILALRAKGFSKRRIARALKISRDSVERVVAFGSAEIPRMERSEKAGPYHERVVELVSSCKGNLVRVHEELVAEGCELSYPALTAYCRRHGLGREQEWVQIASSHACESCKLDAHDELWHFTIAGRTPGADCPCE